LKKVVTQIKNRIEPLIANGFLWIFGGNFAAQFFGFISSVVVIRNLPKAEYGVYVDANNIYSYMAIFIGMGMISAILQFCSENVSQERKTAIYRFAFSKGSVFNIFLMVLIFAVGSIYKPDSAGYYLRMMCGYPLIIYVDNYFQMTLRVKRKNREFGLVYIMYAVTICGGNIIFTKLWGISGLVVSFYFSQMASAITAFCFLRRANFFGELQEDVPALSRENKKQISSYCILCIATNFVTTALVLLDITCLNYVLGDSEVLADYKVASAIPSAMLFVPTSLVTYFYPLMVEAHSSNPESFGKKLREYELVFFGVSLLLFVLMFVFARLIIYIVYGQKYIGVVTIFRILCVNFFINSGVRQLLTNVIYVIKRVKINLILASLAGIMNVLLDLLLIRTMGSEGAAIATVIVTLFISCLEAVYVIYYLKRESRDRLKATLTTTLKGD
jgi:O-antigen/teichoic acid export membrane protein